MNTDQKTWKTRLADNKLLQMLEIIIVLSPGIIALVGLSMLNHQNPIFIMGMLWFANVFILALIWFSVRLRGETLQSIGLSIGGVTLRKIGWTVLQSIAVLIFAIVGFIIGAIIMVNLVSIPEGGDFTQYNYLQGNLPLLLFSLAGIYIVSSIGEEVVYRGFLITRLQSIFGASGKIPVVMAILLSSIIFGLAHYNWGISGVVQTTFMGAALGIAFLLTKRRLLPLILAHGAMDTLLMVQLYMAPVSGS